jgi:hypothetical protein
MQFPLISKAIMITKFELQHMRLENKTSHYYKLVCENTEEPFVPKILKLTIQISRHLILEIFSEIKQEVNLNNIYIFRNHVPYNEYSIHYEEHLVSSV